MKGATRQPLAVPLTERAPSPDHGRLHLAVPFFVSPSLAFLFCSVRDRTVLVWDLPG